MLFWSHHFYSCSATLPESKIILMSADTVTLPTSNPRWISIGFVVQYGPFNSGPLWKVPWNFTAQWKTARSFLCFWDLGTGWWDTPSSFLSLWAMPPFLRSQKFCSAPLPWSIVPAAVRREKIFLSGATSFGGHTPCYSPYVLPVASLAAAPRNDSKGS